VHPAAIRELSLVLLGQLPGNCGPEDEIGLPTRQSGELHLSLGLIAFDVRGELSVVPSKLSGVPLTVFKVSPRPRTTRGVKYAICMLLTLACIFFL
jgi:hypothetical protein